jgi:hypothetical protein
MARGQKRNPGRNKKRVVTKKEIVGPAEYEGYKLTQEVWVRMDIYGGTEWAFGPIRQFHPKDSIQPSFSFYDKVRKRFATAPVANIEESPPKKWTAKI